MEIHVSETPNPEKQGKADQAAKYDKLFGTPSQTF